MTRARKDLGGKGEKIAGEYLQRKGYKILLRNYRNRYGEVDLVAQDEKTVVFVEVKTKSGEEFGSPYEMVSHWKLSQIRRMGEMYCQEYEWDGVCRVDVVGVFVGDEVEVKHYENVTS